MSTPSKPSTLPARLTLADAVSIIVGIVVGTAIFKTPQYVAANVEGPWQCLGAWAIGGALALVGAWCYAELATAYPRSGGDYVFLTHAFGSAAGFLFGWAQLTVVLTGSIGAMAYAFADYAAPIFKLEQDKTALLASGAVIVLTALNLLGVTFGKSVQNFLTTAKVIGLSAIIVVGLAFASDAATEAVQPMSGPGWGLAMVFVLYAYGGWNDAAFVAAEVKERERNMPLALVLGTVGITVIYLIVNAAYLWGLGFEGLRSSSAPAADTLKLATGAWGARAISVIVMISALGAMNGLILTGSRVVASLGEDHRVFATLGKWHERSGSPFWAILALGAVSLLLVVVVGTATGRSLIDEALGRVSLVIPWDDYFGGFDTLVAGTAPVFWLFFLLTGVSVITLRFTDPKTHRPFRTPLFPLTPILFCGMCVYMLYSSLEYAKWLSLLGFVPLALGLPLYLWSWTMRDR